MTAVGRLVISRLLNFATGLERVYDPFLFPVLGTKESIKKGKTIFAIQLAVYIYQKYIQCRFIYLFVLYSEICDRFPENGGNRYGSTPVRVDYSCWLFSVQAGSDLWHVLQYHLLFFFIAELGIFSQAGWYHSWHLLHSIYFLPLSGIRQLQNTFTSYSTIFSF